MPKKIETKNDMIRYINSVVNHPHTRKKLLDPLPVKGIIPGGKGTGSSYLDSVETPTP